jgi:hypothetical protein
MPKANVVLPDGTKVAIEGTAEEVAAVLHRISSGAPNAGSGVASGSPKRRRRATTGRGSSPPKKKSRGPADYIRELITEDFFKTKRGISDVQKKLEEGAHIFPVTHLSPVLLRLVRGKELRRIKEGGMWKYVNR